MMFLYICFVKLFTLYRLSQGNTGSQSPVCTEALGMEDGTIPDSSITSSSIYGGKAWGTHSAANGRLHFVRGNGRTGAWSAAINNQHQWLQVDFGSETVISSVATQGRGEVSQWVTSYSLSYSPDGVTFYSYQNNKIFKVFPANSDRGTVVTHTLPVAVVTRYVRILPRSWKGHISMRAELYGCKLEKLFPHGRSRPILTSTLFDKDRSVVDHVIDTAMVSNVDGCARRCFSSLNCVSLNFEYLAQNVKTCELNNSTKELMEVSFVKRHGFVYYG